MDSRAPFGILGSQTPEEIFDSLCTPCYVIDESALKHNGEILKGVSDRTGAKILLAQKAFSNFDCYPILQPYLAGTEASGLFEARLGHEEWPAGEVHVFCGAYRADEFDELLHYADHIVFNSPGQLAKFGEKAKAAGKILGLRINPECSTQEGHAIYDPCAPGSRLGTTRTQWDAQMTEALIGLLDGLHFHTLCEQDSDALETTLDAVAAKFGDVLPRMRWLNMGGGHHITRPDYDIPRLERCIRRAQQLWNVEVYLEPGEAVALNAGFLCSRVLDIVENNGVRNAILDASAACHMPDVIEMPYQPPIYGTTAPEKSLPLEGKGDRAAVDEVSDPLTANDDRIRTEETPHPSPVCALVTPSPQGEGFVYRLGGPTCLAGDIIGDYVFPRPLQEGDMLLFGDLAIYSTCKNNTFNGMPLPDIWLRRKDGQLERLTAFGYRDFKYRLGKT